MAAAYTSAHSAHITRAETSAGYLLHSTPRFYIAPVELILRNTLTQRTQLTPFTQTGFWVLSPKDSVRMLHVLRGCTPLKVFQPIVESNAVFMVALCALHSCKRTQNKSCYRHPYVLAVDRQAYLCVTCICHVRFQ